MSLTLGLKFYSQMFALERENRGAGWEMAAPFRRQVQDHALGESECSSWFSSFFLSPSKTDMRMSPRLPYSEESKLETFK